MGSYARDEVRVGPPGCVWIPSSRLRPRRRSCLTVHLSSRAAHTDCADPRRPVGLEPTSDQDLTLDGTRSEKRVVGLEPTSSGTTTQGSTVELDPRRDGSCRLLSSIRHSTPRPIANRAKSVHRLVNAASLARPRPHWTDKEISVSDSHKGKAGIEPATIQPPVGRTLCR